MSGLTIDEQIELRARMGAARLGLTARQTDVALAITRGHTTSATIATAIGTTPLYARQLLYEIYDVTGASSKTGLLARVLGLRRGMTA